MASQAGMEGGMIEHDDGRDQHPQFPQQTSHHHPQQAYGTPEGAATTPATPSLQERLLAHRESLVDLAVVLLLLLVLLVADSASPRVTWVSKDALPDLSKPLKEPQTVPSWVVPLVAIVAPILVFVAHKHLFAAPSIPPSNADVARARNSGNSSFTTATETYRLILGILMSSLFTGVVTNIVKIAISRPRPNFMAQCWGPGADPVWTSSNAYGGYPACTLARGSELWKSFPSGHSSMSAAGLGFFTYYLIGQLRAFSINYGRGDGSGGAGGGGGGSVGKQVVGYWRLAGALLPAFGALMIGVSRVADYWHHPSDVIAGLVLGFLVAYGFYRQLYPPFSHEHCDVPLYELSVLGGYDGPVPHASSSETYQEDQRLLAGPPHHYTFVARQRNAPLPV